MIPDPLHPAVVHFPLALAVLVPLAALWALLASRRSESKRAAWLPVAALACLLAGSAWFAEETGEEEEDRVEALVGDDLVHDHEETVDPFQVGTWLLVAASLLALAPGRAGRLGRGATVGLAAAVLYLGVRVGHTGGEIVHGEGGLAAPGGSIQSGD